MAGKSDLFILIKSLTRNEKGYFKRFAATHKSAANNKTIALFKAIEAQKNYNEEKIRRRFKNEKFLKNLSVAKAALIEQILESLQQFHNKTIKHELKSLLRNSEILYSKRHFRLCSETISRGKKLSEKYDDAPYYIQFCNIQIDMMRALGYNESEITFDQIFKDMQDWLNRQKTILIFKNIYVSVYKHLNRHGYMRSESELKKYDTLLKTNLPELDERSFYCKYYYNWVKYFISESRGNYSDAYKFSKLVLNLFDENKHMMVENEGLYITQFTGYIQTAIRSKNFRALEGDLEKLRNAPMKTEYSKYQALIRSYNGELLLNINRGDFKKAKELIPVILKKIEDPASVKYLLRGEKAIVYSSISYIYMGLEEYSVTNKFLNKCIDATGSDLRNDAFLFARLIQLIVQYEMGKEDMVEYYTRSLYRILLKRNSLYEFERITLKFIRNNLNRGMKRIETINRFKDLKIQLEKLKKDPFESRPLFQFDFITWLESKIEGVSFAKKMKDKSE